MKIFYILLFLIIATSLRGQNLQTGISIEDKEFNDFFFDKENIPIVKGRLLNVPEKDIEKVTIRYSFQSLIGNKQINKTCKLNKDGTFQLELDYAIPYQQIWISIGRIYHAYLYAVNDLFIELDVQRLIQEKGIDYYGAGIEYFGADGELNTIINKHKIYKGKRQLELETQIHYFKNRTNLDIAGFIAKYDSMFSYLFAIDNEFIKQNQSKYNWIIQNERLSEYYSNIIVNFHNRDKKMTVELLEKVFKHKPLVIAESSMGFYNKLFYYQMRFSNISEYQYKIDIDKLKTYSKLTPEQSLFLDTVVYEDNLEAIYSILNDTMKIAQYLALFENIDSIYDTPKADLLKLNFIQGNPSENSYILQALKSNLKTRWCKKIVGKEYEENERKLSEVDNLLSTNVVENSNSQIGKFISETPSGAKLYLSEDKSAADFITSIKNNFQNKNLIIDFWATWCGPCINQLPYSQKLHNEFKSSPVEFIYICTSQNSTMKDWISKITDLKLSGIHVFVPKEKVDNLQKAFSITGFPSYIFIDSNGNYKPGTISNMINLDKEKLNKLINE